MMDASFLGSPLTFCRILLLILVLIVTTAQETDQEHQKRLQSHLEMFHPPNEIRVLGPTYFPHPGAVDGHDDDESELVAYLKPALGKHRRDKDAVFAYAAEYPLQNFVTFVSSLRETGFTGDIVLSVSELDLRDKEVKAFLSSDPGLIVYTPGLVCFTFEMEQVESAKGGIRTCQCHDLYGRKHANGTVTALKDPRGQRTIATIRYEVYWIMVQHYNPDSWILLVDARDTYFQTNPFEHVPRKTDPSGKSGVLYFFGENIEATRIGRSKANRKWIEASYGDVVIESLAEKPTICSGATLGEQVALETYLRAMAAEADETGVALMGADQGFHNYLYYSQKLMNALAIHDIVVFDQGTGIVNNLGAMRTSPLENWGNGKILKAEQEGKSNKYQVLNWDGTPSAVVHQFDRHRVLTEYFYKERGGELVTKWKKSNVQL